MSMWRQLTHGVRSLWNGGATDRSVDEEIRSFMDEAAAAYEADGLTPADAQRAARRRVGNPLSVRQHVRAAGWEHFAETVAADLRYGVRRLVRNPGFACITVGTLGLGIGAATAMLSVAGPVIVQTLPFPNADRIRAIWDQTEDGARSAIAFGTFLELQQRSRSFTSMAVAREWQPTLTGASLPERLEGQAVSHEYFQVFGVSPRMGRTFAAAEDVANAPPVVIVSDRLWRRHFAAAPDVIGRQVILDGHGYEVIGVMPAAFEHRLMPRVDVWRALQYDRTLPSFQAREWGHHLRMVARLRDGVAVDAAAAELAQIARAPIPQIVRPPWATMLRGVTIQALHADLTSDARPAMLAVLTAAGLLLLIASVNVVNLLLGRDVQRRAEFVMRHALGAGRSRLVRQLLTETVVLALLSGAAGLFIAHAFIRALVVLGPEGMPQIATVSIDAPVFLLTLLVTVVAGALVGVIPALSRRDLQGVPHGSWQASSSHHLTRRALVVAEIAFALVLIVGAGLLFQSLQRLFAISPGFDGRNVLAAQVQVAGPRFADAAATHRYFEEILDAVRSVPGVSEAGLTSQLPLSGESDAYGVQFERTDSPIPDAGSGAFRYAVSPDYFTAMGIEVRRGRLFSPQDTATAPLVAVISESLARSRFPGGDAIGQRLHAGPTNRPWFTVVGVVGDVKQLSLETDWHDAVYMPPAQWHFADRAFWLVIKASDDAARLTPVIRAAIWSIDKEQPIVRVSTLDEVVASTARQRRFALLLFQAFGLAALLLTAVGLYGVVASAVTERTREIGVRTALGATRFDILQLVMNEGASMAWRGILLGVVAAAIATRGLTALLFGVSRFDVMSYAAVALLLIAVTALACWVPARRAAGIDPVRALGAE